jgi:hypothetical protein
VKSNNDERCVTFLSDLSGNSLKLQKTFKLFSEWLVSTLLKCNLLHLGVDFWISRPLTPYSLIDTMHVQLDCSKHTCSSKVHVLCQYKRFVVLNSATRSFIRKTRVPSNCCRNWLICILYWRSIRPDFATNYGAMSSFGVSSPTLSFPLVDILSRNLRYLMRSSLCSLC